MSTSNQFYAAKTRRIAPLTDVADSFSPSTYAKPDFSQGRVITASFKAGETAKLEFGPSYSEQNSQMMGQTRNG